MEKRVPSHLPVVLLINAAQRQRRMFSTYAYSSATVTLSCSLQYTVNENNVAYVQPHCVLYVSSSILIKILELLLISYSPTNLYVHIPDLGNTQSSAV